MRKTLFSILAMFMAMTFSQAQSAQFASFEAGKMTDGTITYQLSVEDSPEPSAAMLNGSTITLAFNGNKSKMNAFVMGGMFSADMIVDAGNKKGLALLNIMGNKKAIKMTNAEITEAQNATKYISQAKIQKLSGTKKIAGYSCEKLLIANPDKPEDKMIIYVTNAIQPKSGGLLDNMYKEFNGFPLGMELNSKEGKIKLMATEISSKRPKASEFKLAIPKDYEETTMQELGQEMGGMMGG